MYIRNEFNINENIPTALLILILGASIIDAGVIVGVVAGLIYFAISIFGVIPIFGVIIYVMLSKIVLETLGAEFGFFAGLFASIVYTYIEMLLIYYNIKR